jgi:hypothetical protein
MSPRKNAGYHYLKHAIEAMGITLDDFAQTVKVYRCAACGSHYCDPWISRKLAASLFCVHAPDHSAGWANFEHWLSSENLNDDQRRNHKLDKLLAARLGPIASYAEFGCPFQGFLLEMKGGELGFGQRLQAFSRALHRAPDARWTRVTRIYHRAATWANRLTIGYLRLRAIKESLRTVRQSAHTATMLRPGRRALLIQDASTCWGSNCVRYGASCRYFANCVLDADVLPFHELAHDSCSRLDLIGIFNILDHTRSPLEVIRSSLQMAKAVLVVTHSAASAGKQHLYAFADSFPNWLNAELKDTVVEDLAPHIDGEQHGDYRCLLLSRRL